MAHHRFYLLLIVFWLSPAVAHAEGPLEDREALAPFFQKLEALKHGEGAQSGPVRLSWYGDSAIVSDGYTHVVRDRLQEAFADGGPGFVLIEAPFAGYRRYPLVMQSKGWQTMSVLHGRATDGRYGYGGVRARSFGGADLHLRSQGAPFEVLKIAYWGHPAGGRLQVFVEGSGQPRYVHETASEEEGLALWELTLDAPVTRLRLRAGGGGLVELYGVSLEKSEPGFLLDALGIIGIRARRWLQADKVALAEQVRQQAPSLILLNFGGNERVDLGLTAASHRDDILNTLEALRAGAAEASCVIMGPILQGLTNPPRPVIDPALTRIYAGQREAARRAGCAFIDTLSLMGGPEALREWRQKGWLSGDYAHLTGKGHRELGDRLGALFLAGHAAWQVDHQPEAPAPSAGLGGLEGAATPQSGGSTGEKGAVGDEASEEEPEQPSQDSPIWHWNGPVPR